MTELSTMNGARVYLVWQAESSNNSRQSAPLSKTTDGKSSIKYYISQPYEPKHARIVQDVRKQESRMQSTKRNEHCNDIVFIVFQFVLQCKAVE